MEKKIIKNPYTGVMCEVTEVKCKCPCHDMDGRSMMHMVACCDNGKVKIYTPITMILQDIKTWSISKGIATPKNDRQFSQVIKGVPCDSTISPSEEWLKFDQFAQQHTYATNAPDGDRPAEAFGEIVWQVFVSADEWETFDKAIGLYSNYDEFYKYWHTGQLQAETREFLPFNQQPEFKTAKQILDDVDQWQEYHGIVCDPDDVLAAMEKYASQYKNQFIHTIEARIVELQSELKNPDSPFSTRFIDAKIQEAKHLLKLLS